MSQALLFADEAPGPEIASDATLSPDGLYRYTLRRDWESGARRVNFVMLNPSTADASHDDNTIKKCIKFARRWGYGGLVVTNLFAFRATDPDDLCVAPRPIGPDNDEHIRSVADSSALTVCAWGAYRNYARLRRRGFGGRDREVLRLLLDRGCVPHAIRTTKDGEPGHPLFLPDALDPVRWEDRSR